jgi:hypothetical protein
VSEQTKRTILKKALTLVDILGAIDETLPYGRRK